MVALPSDTAPSKTPSSLELTEQLSHRPFGQSATTSSSGEQEEVDEEENRLSRSSSKDQQETATFIDVQLQHHEQQKHGFSFRELAKFFGPGLLTCVAYVVTLANCTATCTPCKSLVCLLTAMHAGSWQS